MPRMNRRRDDGSALDLGRLAGAVPSEERYAGRLWSVRRVSGARSERAYRCPGCEQDVVPGTPHVVAWPADGAGGVGDRRHWHSGCWAARERRHPGGPTR